MTTARGNRVLHVLSVCGLTPNVELMRTLILVLMPLISWAQSASTVYQTDVNGRRETVSSTDRSVNGTNTERTQSVNGGRVPQEQTSERVVREDANWKVVERIIKRYDANGRVTSTDRVVSEETKLPDGGKLVKETSSRSDINGGYKEMERRTSETKVAGQTSTTNIMIDRPTINGGFATAERRNIVTTGPTDRQSSIETVEQANGNGGFHTVRRNEKTTQTMGGTSTENISNYELDPAGRMYLTAQKVATTTKIPGGGEKVETTLYSKTVAGEVQGPGGRMRVKEQQVLERQVGPDGQVRETLSVRHPSMADPEKLDALHKVSERVCVGKCTDMSAAPTVQSSVKGK